MANISDDERPEIDLIIEQRKRKGLIEYLVRWKGSDDDFKRETWEPVKNLTDYASAIQNFTKSLKEAKKTKRSSSRSRKTSRSRSRSSSRSRRAASGKEKVTSRSHGQQQKAETEKVAATEGENSRSARSSVTKDKTVVTDTNTAPIVNGGAELNQAEPKSSNQEDSSANMKSRQQLEVQRVHNEQRPVREDDLKPRSAIWKVADYAVIVLFILSLIAALFLFLEKFINLDEFKKQAFPNMGVLQARLESVQQSVVDAWLYLIEQIKGTEKVKVTSGA